MKIKNVIIFLFASLFFLIFPGIIKAAPPTNFQTSLIVGSNLNGPSGFDIAPDGRIFILERTGAVKIYKNGALLSQPFVTLPSVATGDRGLIGIAFDPDFLTNHYVYFYYTGLDLLNRLVRFDASSDIGSNGPFIIYQTNQPSNQFHVGGTIQFGVDKKLYLSIGDNGFFPNAQDLTNPFGKILRLNKDGTIPADNPFVNTPNALPEIWAYGFRNPFRFQFDQASGNLYEGDVGEASWEEINLIKKGQNYGWPLCEGLCQPPYSFVNPIYTYSHNGGSAAVVEGPIYHQSLFPADYQGKLFFGDYANGFIKTLGLDSFGNSTTVNNFDLNAGSVVDLKVNPSDGTLYYLTFIPGALYQITYSTGTKIPVANATADIKGGIAPLKINFSSTGSLDPTGLPLTYVWDFGDGTSSSLANPQKIYNQNGRYIVQLKVSNGTFSSLAIPIVVQVGLAPTLNIISPLDSSNYQAGNIISYSASATDGAGLDIAESSFTTEIVFHHQTHIHPFIGPITSRAGQFIIPTTGESSAETWYEIKITATDRYGLSTTKSVSIFPLKSKMTFITNPPGLSIFVDGIPVQTPQTIEGVVGFQRQISTDFTQVQNNLIYKFNNWSDGGGQNHIITTPNSDTTYSANFSQTGPFKAEYFNNPNLINPSTLIRDEPLVNFDWGNGSPDPQIVSDNFSARFSKVENFQSGRYDFTTSTDDGVRLLIDGNLVINKWQDQGTTSYTAAVGLTAGDHTIVMEYYEHLGGAVAKLKWDFDPIQPNPSPNPSATPNQTLLGGLDLNKYCQNLGQTSATLSSNIWVCTPTSQNIDLNKACIFQYNLATSLAKQTDINNPFTWNCYVPIVTPTPTPSPSPVSSVTPVTLGGLDLNGYCSSLGQSYSMILNNIWICQPSNNQIDLNLVCIWQYHNLNTFAKLLDPNNPYTWQCFNGSAPSPSPTPSLTPSSAFSGEYFSNMTLSGTPTLTKQDPTINFIWNGSKPDPSMPVNQFSARWTKTQQFNAGNYNFHLQSDDGVRFWIDNQLIVDDWTDHAMRSYDKSVTLTQGNHNLKIEYYQNSGGDVIVFQIL